MASSVVPFRRCAAAVQDNTEAVRIENISKIFGLYPERGIKLIEGGKSHKELMDAGYVAALRNVSISIRDGEICVIMGLSGSGKSTLVRCINRLIEPTTGSIWIGGRDVTKISPRELRGLRTREVAMVFQKFALFPHMTVLENAAFGLRVMGINRKARREKAAEVLELVGLGGWADRKPRQLSGGMQQRVGLARALAIDPPILLMDEPFGSLDPLIREDMQQELLKLQNRLKKTIVFITHDLAEAIALGNRIAILRQGEIVQEDTPARIVMEPATPYVGAFVRDVNLLNILDGRDLADPNASIISATGARSGRTSGPAILLDEEGRPIGVSASDDDRTAANGVGDRSGRLKLVTVPPNSTLSDYMDAIASDDHVTVAVDQDGRYAGVLSGTSILRALVRTKQRVAALGTHKPSELM